MTGLVAAFLLTALVYASAGFGGGSTYTALLVLDGADHRAIPIVSLCCNIVVVTAGTWRFSRAGHIDWRRAWPLFALSVPAAWVGGRLVVPEILFVGMLAASLIAAGLFMLWRPSTTGPPAAPRGRWLEPVAGGVLGLLAGVVGIGGGVFLAPLLYMLRWGTERAIAGTSAAFILVNSVAGLAGQLGKNGGADGATVLAANWPLLPAVLVGGAIGSTLASRRLDAGHVRIVTALLVLYAGFHLCLRFYEASSGASK